MIANVVIVIVIVGLSGDNEYIMTKFSALYHIIINAP
jgi:hypothetical protein